MSRSVCSAARPLDCAETESALLAHRTRHASGTGQGIALASRHGMGNREHSPWDKDGPQAHPSPLQKQKAKWLHGATAEMLKAVRAGLEDVEKRWVRVGERCACTRRPAARTGSRCHTHRRPPQWGQRRLRVPGHRPASTARHSHHTASSARRTVAVAGHAQKEGQRFLPVWSRDRSRPETICRL